MIAESIYEWENLPDSCNQKFLEKTLFYDGKACFVKHPLNDSIINLKCTPQGQINIYDEPIAWRAYSYNFNEVYDEENIVIVHNNPIEKSTESIIIFYCEKIAEIEETININLACQKTPFIILCDEKQRLTLKNLYEQYQGNAPVIYGNKNLTEILENFKVVSTNAPYLADKLYEQKIKYINELLNILGIETNPSEQKKERLITDEVNANNEFSFFSNEMFLIYRQKATNELNKKYGLNVVVKKREFEGV